MSKRPAVSDPHGPFLSMHIQGSSSEAKPEKKKQKGNMTDSKTPAGPASNNSKQPERRQSYAEKFKNMALPPEPLPKDAKELTIGFQLPAHKSERARVIADAGTTCITVYDVLNTDPRDQDSLAGFVETQLPGLQNMRVNFQLLEPIDHDETNHQMQLILTQVLSVWIPYNLQMFTAIMWRPTDKATVLEEQKEQSDKITELFRGLAAKKRVDMSPV